MFKLDDAVTQAVTPRNGRQALLASGIGGLAFAVLLLVVLIGSDGQRQTIQPPALCDCPKGHRSSAVLNLDGKRLRGEVSVEKLSDQEYKVKFTAAD